MTEQQTLTPSQSAESLTTLIQRMSNKLDNKLEQMNQSVDAKLDSVVSQVNQSVDGKLDLALEQINQSVEEKLEVTVEHINQSVDGKLESGLAVLHQRVETELVEPRSQKAPKKAASRATATTSSEQAAGSSWADIMSEEDGEVDLAPKAKRPKLLPVSEETKDLVKSSFTKVLSNSERREIRQRAPALELPQTRCPRLDNLFKTQESKLSGNSEAKQVDSDLQKVQALMLDTAAPLLELLSLMEEKSEELPRDPYLVAQEAVRLLGNAITQTSKIRRKRVLKVCNSDMQDLVEEEDLFAEALPNLFGSAFEAKMKERAESVKILAKSQSHTGRRFFRGGRHPQAQRGGGHTYYRSGRDQYRGFQNPFQFQRSQRGRGGFGRKPGNSSSNQAN